MFNERHFSARVLLAGSTGKVIKKAVLAGVLLAGALYIANSHLVFPAQPGVSDSARFNEIEWIKHIKLVGGEKAYSDLALSARGLSAMDQHTLAHVFGS